MQRRSFPKAAALRWLPRQMPPEIKSTQTYTWGDNSELQNLTCITRPGKRVCESQTEMSHRAGHGASSRPAFKEKGRPKNEHHREGVDTSAFPDFNRRHRRTDAESVALVSGDAMVSSPLQVRMWGPDTYNDYYPWTGLYFRGGDLPDPYPSPELQSGTIYTIDLTPFGVASDATAAFLTGMSIISNNNTPALGDIRVTMARHGDAIDCSKYIGQAVTYSVPFEEIRSNMAMFVPLKSGQVRLLHLQGIRRLRHASDHLRHQSHFADVGAVTTDHAQQQDTTPT